MGSYLTANPAIATEIRAAMNESIAYSQATSRGQADPRQRPEA